MLQSRQKRTSGDHKMKQLHKAQHHSYVASTMDSYVLSIEFNLIYRMLDVCYLKLLTPLTVSLSSMRV